MRASSKDAAASILNRLLVGRRSEQRALRYLQRRGVRLIERNYRCRQGEIDLIVQDDNAVVFVEVRYRRSQRFGGASASITRAKQQRIIRTAQYYLAVTPAARDSACRFDVVCIEKATGGGSHIEWLRDAFRAENSR